MKRVLAVVNPVAGGGRAARIWADLAPLGVDCVATERPRHATELARSAQQQGFERVIAVGGDGTVSEVAAGLIGSDCALGILPAGTGNDLSRTLGVPKAAAAMRLALQGNTRQIDVGRVGERVFVNVAGCGFDAEVVKRLGTHGGGLGVAYLIGVFRTVVNYKPRRLHIEVDGVAIERQAVGVAVANGPRYGGGLRIAPRASVDDGVFDVCVVGALSAPAILGLVPFLYAGAHARYPGVEFLRGRRVQVSGEATCQADGELSGDLPAVFTLEPRALKVVVP